MELCHRDISIFLGMRIKCDKHVLKSRCQVVGVVLTLTLTTCHVVQFKFRGPSEPSKSDGAAMPLFIPHSAPGLSTAGRPS